MFMESEVVRVGRWTSGPAQTRRLRVEELGVNRRLTQNPVGGHGPSSLWSGPARKKGDVT